MRKSHEFYGSFPKVTSRLRAVYLLVSLLNQILPQRGWYSRDSLCYGVRARMIYIMQKCKKKKKNIGHNKTTRKKGNPRSSLGAESRQFPLFHSFLDVVANESIEGTGEWCHNFKLHFFSS